MEQITSIYEIYSDIVSNPKYGFKSCGDSIVVLEKLEDTITNESRQDIIDPLHASYRGNKFFVKIIFKKMMPSMTLDYIHNTTYLNDTMVYKTGEICETSFDNDITQVNSSGIHYFISVDTAFYYNMTVDDKYTGWLWEYYPNGAPQTVMQLKNGKLNGVYKHYNLNNKLTIEQMFSDGVLDGISKEYYTDGRIRLEQEFKNGNKNGFYRKWLNDTVVTVCNYDNNQLHGKFTQYHLNGKEIDVSMLNLSEEEKKNILESTREKGRHVKLYGKYSDGKKVGEWYEYNETGDVINTYVY